jgi:uncharacterized protein (TIGR02391 family)
MAAELDASDLAVLPVDELALWLLANISTQSNAIFTRVSELGRVLKEFGQRMPRDSAYLRGSPTDDAPHLAKALAEAWDWLYASGLIAEAVTGIAGGWAPLEGYMFVTRLGERVTAHPRALEWLSAERRLGMTLHPRLEERARRQFVMGEFDAATLIAMREVEIAVRERAGLDDCVIGTELMNKAFADDGPLADQQAAKAEREGMKSLYRGAMSVFKNPASHRSVELTDPSEAAEIVLFADLLLRMLDRYSSGT